MLFRLAVLGHSSSIEEIKEIVAARFENTEVVGISLSTDEEVEQAKERLLAALPSCSGVLYTRQDPYRLMISRVEHGDTPVRYVDIDASSFVHSLLEASYHDAVDICRVSVDTLSFETVTQAYGSLGIPREKIDLRIVNVDTSAEHFVQSVARTHRENYASGRYSVCVTNIRNVCDALRADGIPCVLMAPSRDTYTYEIRRLMVSHQFQRRNEGNIAILDITASPSNEQYMRQRTLEQGVLDHNRVSELIAYFAQRLCGAYIRAGSNDHYILCEYDDLARETEGFSKLDLLRNVYLNTPYALSIGIGIGKNMRGAFVNAELGARRAANKPGNCAYVVYAQDRVVGPIEPNELVRSGSALFDQRFTLAAEACGLSINTIFRIDTFVKQKNNRSFVTSELADELGVSDRTAARVVTKLEQKGYAMEIGKAVTGDKGRPTRVFKLLW